MADKLIAVKMRAEGGNVVKAELTDIGREGTRAFGELQNGSRGSGMALQNVGFQVQDFAVQVAGGTDATRALAQQLPQLLSGFGLLGVAAGTLVAAGAPIASMLFDIGDAGKATEENLKTLDQAIQTLRQTSEQFTAKGLDEMRQKYGEINAELGLMIERQRQLAISEAMDAARTATEGLRDDFAGLKNDLEAVARIEESIASGTMTSTQMLDAQDAISAILDDINSKYGLSREQLAEMVALSDQLAVSAANNDPSATAETLSQILGLLDQSKIKYDETYQSILDAEGILRQLPAALEQSLSPLGALVDLAGSLWSNLAAAASVRINAASVDPLAPPQGATRPRARPGGLEFEVSETGGYNLPAPRRSGGGGGRRGGGGRAGIDPALREAERLFESTRTAAEKYDVEVQKVAELHAKFPALITDDVQARALEDLREKLLDTKDSTEDLKDSFKDMFQSILDGSMTAGEVLSNLLASFASNLLSSGLDGLWEGLGLGDILGGFANGGAFDKGRVMAFASGGVVDQPTWFGMRGGMGLMGEAGPEAILPLSRGSDGKLGVRSAGGNGGVAVNVSINVDARGAVDGVAAQVAEAVRAQTPGIVKQAVAGVASARQRGYAV